MTEAWKQYAADFRAMTDEEIQDESNRCISEMDDGGSHAESPPEPASVEIQSVVPDVPESCYDTLVEECFQDHADHLDRAAEWRADMRRDDYADR